MLKETKYRDFNDTDRPTAGVKYLILDNCCVFSGISPNFTSTINAAERVILAIAEAECIDPCKFTFFDLQTVDSYPSLSPSQYIFQQLDVTYHKEGPEVTLWSDKDCPREVIREFGLTHASN